MLAIVCDRHGEPDVMQLVETDDPQPAGGEIRIKAEAIGVNFVDTMRRSGRHPSAPATPFTPGIELVGTVDAVGSDVSDFQVGDRVIGRCETHGGYAELVSVETRFAVHCPEQIPDATAAALFVNPQTAYHALVTMGQARDSDQVLITAAAGGVGICAVQIAKALGARVIAVASTDEKRQLASEFGADVVIDYSQSNWPQQVLDATDGNGATLILESVGGQIFQQALECWAPGGRIVVFGQASGEPGIIAANQLLFGNRSVYGLAVGTVIENESLMRSAMDKIFQWYQSGRLRLVVGETHPLKDAALAHKRLEGRLSHGKIVLVP